MSRNDKLSREEWRELCDEVEASFKESSRKDGRNYRILCPRCTSSKTGRSDYSMGVHVDGRFHCHRCGIGGKLRDAIDPDAVVTDDEPIATTIDIPEGFIPLGWEPGLSAESLIDARAYATKRHLTPDMCRLLGVGAVLEGYYAGRIVIPVRDDEGEWTGFVSRDWTGRAQKPYLYSKGFSRSRFWNHVALSEETDEPLIVVEGVLDAVPYWPDGIAMLGKLSEPQKIALCTTLRPIALVFDGDACIEARATAMELRVLQGKRCGWVELGPKIDPDQVDFTWLRQRARECLEEEL